MLLLWSIDTVPLLLYNRTASVKKGWYIKQLFTLSCSPTYVAIDPQWILPRVPHIARSLLENNTVIVKYILTETRDALLQEHTPEYIQVFSESKQGIDSSSHGLVPLTFILGYYCPL